MARLPSADDARIFAWGAPILGLLLWISSGGFVLAIAAVGAAGLLVVGVSVGLEKAATAIIFLAVFFAPLNDVRPSETVSFLTGADLSFLTVADLFFVLGLVLLAPMAAFRKFSPPPFFVVGSIVLVSMAVVASLGSTDPVLSLNHMTRLVVAALCLPAAFMFWRPDKRIVASLAAAYIAGQVVSVGYGLYEGGVVGGRYDGLATHTNFFGLSALLAASLVPYVASLTRPSWRWMPWAAGAVCLYGIWISGSRAALLAILLIAAIYPVFERSVKAAGLLALAGVVALISADRFLDDSGENAASRLLGGGHADYSDAAREDLAAEAVDSFYAHPLLGTGFVEPLAAHNIYLEIVVAVGIFGLIGYVFVLWSTVSPLFTLPRPFNQLAYPALAYASVGMITNALWDRFIWAALALSLIATLLAEDNPPVDEGAFDPQHRE